MTFDVQRETSGEGALDSRFPSDAARLTAVLLSCVALAVVLWGVFQLDLPLARFLRSIHSEGLDRASEMGNRLGNGWVLAGISVTLLAAGWLLKRPTFRQAGLDGLIAHAAAALAVQALKHLIGRPRPRMTHGGGFQFGPSWDSGLDSFPSGHAAASFAVAAVLARHFPRAAWLFYGGAGGVAVSRVVRGSHFPTDVVAGLCLGMVVGALVANSVRAWRTSVSQAVIHLTPYLVGGLALVWIAVHPSPDERTDLILLGAGTIVMGIGIAGRLYWAGKGRGAMGDGVGHHTHSLSLIASRPLIGIGLALTTGSLLITTLAGLAILALWLASRPRDASPDPINPAARKGRSVLSEAALAVGLFLAVVLLQGLKGILPILSLTTH